MSGEKIPYHLRQNKYVDRELFLESLGLVDRVRAVRDYLYVSFGGPYLEDFKVVHAAFGNEHMLSLEQEEWVFARQKFNLPFGCVTCNHMRSDQFISDFNEVVRSFGGRSVIVWFDYASAAALRQQVLEFYSLLGQLREYDVIRLTLNANPTTLASTQPGALETADELRQRRFRELQARLGDYLPGDCSADDLTEQRYPVILLKALQMAAVAGLRGNPNHVYQPLNAFAYKDGAHQMLTVTGIILRRENIMDFLTRTGFDRHEFRSLDWSNVIKIDVPYLSTREKFYLDNLLFKRTHRRQRSRLKSGTVLQVRLAKTPEDSAASIEQYLTFYRHYPHYHRIHY
jgi:hypothetical protein